MRPAWVRGDTSIPKSENSGLGAVDTGEGMRVEAVATWERMRARAPQDQDGPTDAIRGAALITAGEDRS